MINPDQFDHFARKNCYQKYEGKCIHFIFGIKNAKSTIQSTRLSKKVWDKESAKSFCKSHKGDFEG